MDILTFIETLILGAVQGLTEFIPVSSSGHLVVLGDVFRDHNNLHLLVQALDFGTVLALIIFFRHRIADLFRQVFVKRDYKLFRNLIITAFPVCLVGLILHKLIEHSDFFTSATVVAIAMGLIGILMIILDKLPHKSSVADGHELTPLRALVIGLAQCCALIPGISRSGSTIIAGKFMGLNSKAAAEYSFMASLPVMLALVAKLIVGDHSYLIQAWPIVLLGNIAAFIFGMAAIKFLLNYLSRRGVKAFGYYRVILAAIIVVVCIGIKVF